LDETVISGPLTIDVMVSRHAIDVFMGAANNPAKALDPLLSHPELVLLSRGCDVATDQKGIKLARFVHKRAGILL
jgi:hypothetical protein